MVIFDCEKKDGIAELISSKASVVFDSQLITSANPDATKSIASLLTIDNPNQIDLFYLDAILASTGWNKNDDVFDKFETWKAKRTPIDKPFNFMHDGNDIIGHITSSIVVSQEGKIVGDDTPLDDIPENFDVLVSSVIYKKWPEENRTEEISEIIKEIGEGKWFVSMECLFPSFDYAVIDEAGNQYTITRNEHTSFLTKHLRVYGGTGVYQNHKIGRLLRDFTFCGKGLVNQPANPRSIIFNDSIIFNGSEASVKMFSETEGKNTMSDEKLETKISDLEKQIASLTEENKTLKAQAEEEAKQGYEDKIAALEAEITTIKAQLSEKETTVAELQKSSEEANKALASKEEELNKIKTEMIVASRTNKLTQAGLSTEEVATVLAKWQSVDEAMFDEVVTLHAEAKKNCAKKDEMKEECSKSSDELEDDKAAADTPATVEVAEEPNDKSLATEGENPEEAKAQTLEVTKAGLRKLFKTTRNKKQ